MSLSTRKFMEEAHQPALNTTEVREFATVRSPVGLLRVGGTNAALDELRFVGKGEPGFDGSGDGAVACAVEQLQEYFAGRLRKFTVTTRFECGTPFQRRVWKEIARIPFGSVKSYGDIARLASSPAAVRAVGQACGANPIAIIVPCHRVLAAGGRMGGYGGGIDKKEWLLAHEGIIPTGPALSAPARSRQA
jgi:methylated-DNA-[protein]-cysteine S-methyltransferase